MKLVILRYCQDDIVRCLDVEYGYMYFKQIIQKCVFRLTYWEPAERSYKYLRIHQWIVSWLFFSSLGYKERILRVLLMPRSRHSWWCLLWFDGQTSMEIIVLYITACFAWFLLVSFNYSKICKNLKQIALDKKIVKSIWKQMCFSITCFQWLQIGCYLLQFALRAKFFIFCWPFRCSS